MHERAAEFQERTQDRYGVDVDVLEFDAGTETAAAAADAVGCDTAAIASTIVVSLSGGEAGADEGVGTDEDQLVAAITSGANRLDLNAVAERFGAASAAMADPERIREVVGWSIGGVPPIGHDASLPTVFDPTLTEYDTVYGAAGTPSTVFATDPEMLVDLADATVVDLIE